MCVTICGKFCQDEGAVAGYGNRIRTKYIANCGVQIAGMLFPIRSGEKTLQKYQKCKKHTRHKRSML